MRLPALLQGQLRLRRAQAALRAGGSLCALRLFDRTNSFGGTSIPPGSTPSLTAFPPIFPAISPTCSATTGRNRSISAETPQFPRFPRFLQFLRSTGWNRGWQSSATLAARCCCARFCRCSADCSRTPCWSSSSSSATASRNIACAKCSSCSCAAAARSRTAVITAAASAMRRRSSCSSTSRAGSPPSSAIARLPSTHRGDLVDLAGPMAGPLGLLAEKDSSDPRGGAREWDPWRPRGNAGVRNSPHRGDVRDRF